MTKHYEDDEIFQDIDSFYKRIVERMFKEMKDFETAIQGGKLKGHWKVNQIDKPGMKGYVMRGRFQTGNEPTQIPKSALNEKREPLTDIFDEKDKIRIYIELPGVDKKEIKLDVTDHAIEVKAKDFFKRVQLPAESVDREKASATCKNGVLEISVPKIEKIGKDAERRSIAID
ncbi:MAG: Hsp20/alpha crystallin family protein [Candidatus Bathyarchaeota archaeon]|nr:MAG: Hsp20/alpha crystallin family protein [Candidatus Bathyarchaeota archaeon]